MINPKLIAEWEERYRFSGPDARYKNKGTVWFEFGMLNGTLDISDGNRDVFEGVSRKVGEALLDLHRAVTMLLEEREELLKDK